MRPVCCKCHKIMSIDKIGVDFVEIVKEVPYRVWSMDRFKCHQCGATFLAASGFNAYSNSFDVDFNDVVNIVFQREDTVIERE